MNVKELGQQLRTFNAERHRDPVGDTLTLRIAPLEAQLQAAKHKLTEAQQADVDATLRAEAAIAQGDKVDKVVLQRLRADVVDAEHTSRLVSNALEQIRRDVAKANAARADRDVATLTPIFRELMTLADQRAEALLEVTDLLDMAHHTANGALPGASYALQGGFAGLLSRAGLEHWRQRGEAADLLPLKAQKVA